MPAGTVMLMAHTAPGCSGTPERKHPGILLISIDTLRPDHTSAYGYGRPTTPVLDSLAREGALFAHAVSTSNWTLPAHMSLLTGLYPSGHGVEEQHDGLDPSIRTLAEALSESGYATAGFTSHTYLDARYGFARGFEHYETVVDRRAEEVSRRAVDWLASRETEPFFLFLHYFDPHWDYGPPEPHVRRFGAVNPAHGTLDHLFPYFDRERAMPAQTLQDVLALYDAEIAYTDSQIGHVLDRLRDLGRLDSTVVVVVSDHGEEFGEHGSFGHGTHLHGEVTRIPLLVRYPPLVPRGERRTGVASLVDIPATVLSLAGLESGAQWRVSGRALFPGRNEGAGRDRAVILESTRWGPKRFAVRGPRFKLMGGGYYRPLSFVPENGNLRPIGLAPRPFLPQLFDVLADPAETANLLPGSAAHPVASDLRETLDSFIRGTVAGVRLTCAARDEGPWYTGTVRFTTPLADEAFSTRPGPTADVATPGPTEFLVRLRPDAEDLSIVFPVRQRSGEMTVQLARGGRPYFDGTFPLPSPGETRRLGGEPGSAEGCRVTVPREAGPVSRKATVTLGAEDLRKLRALGYVE